MLNDEQIKQVVDYAQPKIYRCNDCATFTEKSYGEEEVITWRDNEEGSIVTIDTIDFIGDCLYDIGLSSTTECDFETFSQVEKELHCGDEECSKNGRQKGVGDMVAIHKEI